MGGWKNSKKKKNKESCEVFGTIEGVYSRVYYLGEGRLRECKESSSKIWGKDKHGSKKTGKVGYSKRTRFQKRRVTKKVYGKGVI